MTLRLCLPALLALLVASGSRANTDPSRCWRELAFEAGNSWASATVVLDYSAPAPTALAAQLHTPADVAAPVPPAAGTTLLRARFDAMLSHGELALWYDRDSGNLLQVLRTGSGRESRRKLHRVLGTGVWRERRAPGDGGGDRPEDWEVRSRTVIPFPPGLAPGTALLAPEMLIAEAARMVASDSTATRVYVVLSDTHFYEVRLHEIEARRIETSVQMQTGNTERMLDGERSVRRVAVDAQVLTGERGEDPLRLLELEGDLQIAIDLETLLPVRVQGTWMRVGTVPANLVRARVQDGCPG